MKHRASLAWSLRVSGKKADQGQEELIVCLAHCVMFSSIVSNAEQQRPEKQWIKQNNIYFLYKKSLLQVVQALQYSGIQTASSFTFCCLQMWPSSLWSQMNSKHLIHVPSRRMRDGEGETKGTSRVYLKEISQKLPNNNSAYPIGWN